jgi:hypothetical protein
VSAYALRPEGEYFGPRSEHGRSAGGWRTIGGVTGLVLAAGAGAVGASFVIGSRSAAREAEGAPNQARAQELNRLVTTRNRHAAVALGVGGVAAISAALLLVWPDSKATETRPLAQVNAGGATVGLEGRF